MAKKVLGLASLKVGVIESDGGMSLALAEVGETVVGTATLTSEDNTVTDFNIEESDSPVESIVTTAGKLTFVWSSYKLDGATLYKFLGGTYTPYIGVGGVLTLGSVTGGSSYTNGTYTDVPLTGGAGTGAKGTVVVAGGAVTTVTITTRGVGYAAANNLSALAANIGGTGTGFTVPVATVQATLQSEKWEAPDSFPDVELSIEATDKKGNIVKAPRNKMSTKLGVSFTKDKLGQLDFVATILQPTKSGEKRLTMILQN